MEPHWARSAWCFAPAALHAAAAPGPGPCMRLAPTAAAPIWPLVQAAVLSPDKKVDREYTPKLADAIRAPSPSGALQPDGALPPVGDLFSQRPALPAYMAAGASAVPSLPDWDSRRPYLTGRFLYDAAVEGKGSSSEASRVPALDSYPAAVQESLREWRRRGRWRGGGASAMHHRRLLL